MEDISQELKSIVNSVKLEQKIDDLYNQLFQETNGCRYPILSSELKEI